jgi:hypothetical protein
VHRHPAFPTPSIFSGRTINAQLGHIAPRECGGVCGCLKTEIRWQFIEHERATPCVVVPAKAGTHNHRRLLEQKPSAIVPNREAAAYGSPRAWGRHANLHSNDGLRIGCLRGLARIDCTRRTGDPYPDRRLLVLASWARGSLRLNSCSACHHPPPGRRNAPPDDRLQRMIQYSRDGCVESRGRGVLDAPVPSAPRLRRGMRSLWPAEALARAASRGMTAS